MLDEKTAYVFLKKSSNGGALHLQAEGSDKAEWYYLTEKTKPFADKLKPSDKLNIDIMKKEDKNYISFFKIQGGFSGGGYKGGSNGGAWKSRTSNGARPAYGTGGGSWGKDPETQDSIVKQTVLKGASELVSSLTFKSVEDALEAWDTAFEHMYNRVKTAKADGGLVEVATLADDDEPAV